MKIYKNSTLILGIITVLSFVGVCWFSVGTWLSTVLFSVFGSSLVSFSLSWIYYHGEYEKNITSLTIKVIGIYHALYQMKAKTCKEKINDSIPVHEMEQLLNELKGWDEVLKVERLTENLQNFVVLWQTKADKELQTSLWCIQMNIINYFPLVINVCTQNILKLKLAKLSNNLQEQEENYKSFIFNFNYLYQLLHSHIGLVETTLQKLLNYGYLPTTFKKIQEDTQRQ